MKSPRVNRCPISVLGVIDLEYFQLCIVEERIFFTTSLTLYFVTYSLPIDSVEGITVTLIQPL